jgi:Uri superfamily endonuclease
MGFDYSNKGVYCLIFKNKPSKVTTGKLGDISFKEGYHVYVGSALGPGGLKRVKRHISLSKNRDKNPRWHIDYLHVSQYFELVATICAITDKKYECLVAQKLIQNNWNYIPDFGCSDCSCPSHLFYRKSNPIDEIKHLFLEFGFEPYINHLNFK